MSLKFWKKDDLGLPDIGSSYGKAELGLKDSSGLDLSGQFEPSSAGQGMPPPPPPMPSAFSPPSSFPPPTMQQQQLQQAEPDHSKDLEIIAAKLDTIRAQLEMLNTRMANLEHQSQGAQPKRPWY